MANPQNLIPPKKGEIRNPKGRPKGSRSLSTVLREMLQQLAPSEVIDAKFVKEFCRGKRRITIADAIGARLVNEALIKGESWAIKELADRTEGKATQRTELTGADGKDFAPSHFTIEVISDVTQVRQADNDQPLQLDEPNEP